MPALARHVVRTTPWATVLAGFASGTALLLVLAHVAHSSHSPLHQDTVRIAFLPAVMALSFVVRVPARDLIRATPVPAWLTSAGQILVALPVLALTCWVRLLILASTLPRHAPHPGPAVAPLIAQMVGWCTVAVAAAACCDRSRYADLGGAVAAPVTLVFVLVAWFVGAARRHLVAPPATVGAATSAWYGVAVVAGVVAALALRDGWHRYTRRIRAGQRSGIGRSATTGLSMRPTPSISTSTREPGWRRAGGSRV